jgi:hypothetical protein
MLLMELKNQITSMKLKKKKFKKYHLRLKLLKMYNFQSQTTNGAPLFILLITIREKRILQKWIPFLDRRREV